MAPRARVLIVLAPLAGTAPCGAAPKYANHPGHLSQPASVAHFDMLYFNLRVAGVPLFKADRGAPPVMGVLPIYRSIERCVKLRDRESMW